MPDSCAFCGSTEPMTREHVFGEWVSKIGLDLSPLQHQAGPLNGLPRDMGEQPPYRQRVKRFCGSCNNGWMSRLEDTAKRVLTPSILGEPTIIAPEDQPAIATWVQKTALVAMLVSTKEQREAGYGLSQGEYKALYERRSLVQPLPASQFWVGRYEGSAAFSTVRVTPMVVRVPGIPEPEFSQGYLMTVVLGELVLQGLRFTRPAVQVEVVPSLGMPQLWPSRGPLSVFSGDPCTEALFLRLTDGRLLQSTVRHVELKPWTRASQVAQSVIVDGKVKVPTLCGKHFFYYPVGLLAEALKGRFYIFVTGCECETAYLIQTESDGAHCKAAGAAAGISQMYEDLSGQELLLSDETGAFICKKAVVA